MLTKFKQAIDPNNPAAAEKRREREGIVAARAERAVQREAARQEHEREVAKQLLKIALAARCALERYASDTEGGLFEGFPRGTCGPVSELLGRYLIEAGFKDVMYVCGEKRSEGSHAWVEVAPHGPGPFAK